MTIRRSLSIIGALVLLMTALVLTGQWKLLPAAEPAASAVWDENQAKALAEAKKSGKPILADFTGSDWCGYCIALKKEVFDTPVFKEWAAKNVILL